MTFSFLLTTSHLPRRSSRAEVIRIDGYRLPLIFEESASKDSINNSNIRSRNLRLTMAGVIRDVNNPVVFFDITIGKCSHC